MRLKVKLPRHKMRFRLWVIILFLIIFLSILGIGSYLLYNWHVDNKAIIEISEDIGKDLQIEQKEVPIEETTLVNPPKVDANNLDNDYWYYVNKPFTEVNFSSLLEKNKDTVAYIHMESTNINYPVVSSNDNEFYLTHAYDKKSNSAGWIFLDYRNNFDELSDNTIIYGHARNNTTMFGSLKNVLTSAWQNDKDNYVITISTPKENMLFQIFSIYTIKAESYYITTKFANKDEKIDWLNTMQDRNISKIKTELDENDKILTLSTCKNNSGERIVVHAKLIKKVANAS